MRGEVARDAVTVGSAVLPGQIMDAVSPCLADGLTCAGLPVAFRTGEGVLIGLDTFRLSPLRNGRAGP